MVKFESIDDGMNEKQRVEWKENLKNPHRKESDVRVISFNYRFDGKPALLKVTTTLGPEVDLKKYGEKIRIQLEKIEWW